MGASRGDIFLIPVRERYLLHAPTHGLTALVNEAAAAALQGALDEGSACAVTAELRPLAQRLLEPPPLRPQPKVGPFAPTRLSLLLTNQCNLRCRYCALAAGDARPLTMSRDLCAAAVGFFADIAARDHLRAFSVYFFGGEPFLPWELMQLCITEAERHADRLGVPLVAMATTNGFVSPDRAAWAADHFRFLIVSMDGPPAIHDHFRPTRSGAGSFEVVARSLAVFEERGLEFGLRCTVGRTVVSRMAEIAGFLCEHFRPSVVNFEPVLGCGRGHQAALEPPEPVEFLRGVVAAEAVLRAHGVGLRVGTVQTRRIARSNCGVAHDQFVVTPDGLVSACFAANERASPHCGRFAIGQYDADTDRLRIDEHAVQRVRSYGVESIPRCRDCFCKWHCSGGCRVFYTPPGCDEPPPPMCEMTQTLSLWRLLRDGGFEEEANALVECS